MKLKLIQEEKLSADVTTLTVDNVFSADYLDYVITSHDGLGTVASNALRFIDGSGNERSTSEYQVHQIYGTGSAENYQNSTDQNKYYDAFWKYDDGVNISVMIHNPFDENQQTLLSAFGTASNLIFDASGVYNEAERHRGFKLIQGSSTSYYNTGILSIYGIEY